MTSWQVAFGFAGLVVTLVAVILAAWLSARSIARLCMRREHRLMGDRIDRLEDWKAGHDQFAADLRGRLARIERKLDR